MRIENHGMRAPRRWGPIALAEEVGADERAAAAGPEYAPPAEREIRARPLAGERRGPVLRAASLVGTLLARTFSEWREDHASQYGAAIAYYTFFSIAPLLILAIALAGVFFGSEAAEGRIVTELQGFIGRDGAEAVQALVRRARGSDAGLTVSLAGIGALLLGATQVFNSLQTALNVMWEAPDRTVRTGVKWDLLHLARNRALSFAMVLVVGLLLVLSLLASTGVSLLGTYLSRLGREPAEVLLLRVSEIGLSFGALTCPEDAPWANCLDMPCEIDPLDPALATCQCQLVETGPSFTFGGGCDVSQCTATIWSGAAPPGVTQYLPAMQCLNRDATFPDVCPAGTPVASPAGTPASA